MRIFIALDIDPEIRDRIRRFSEGVRGLAPEVRWVGPETFHITLKFIGEKPAPMVEEVKRVLAGVRAAPLDISFRGYGFFPNARAARVFWVGIEADTRLPALASQVDEAVSSLRIPREEHEFRPHLTLARSGSGRPRPMAGDRPSAGLSRVHQKLQPMPPPDFGTMTAREFFLYESKLSPKGAQYTKIARFALDRA